MPWAAVPTTFVWLALASCGFAMYRLASEWTTPGNAVIAAAFYMVHPYMLFTFYERAAYAELLAAAWIPLLLLAVLRPRLTVAGLAIPIALLWLTNAPAAVMGCYAFVLLGVARTASTWRTQDSNAALREAAKIAVGAILGIGLAAFYVVPATIEQRWVKITMPLVRGVRYQDNFLFAHIGSVSHDAILRTASLCGVALVALAAVFLAKALHSANREPGLSQAGSGVRKRNLLALFLLTSMAAFLLTSPSAVLWRHVPELSNLQFPWRFCAILGAAAAALLALAMPQTRKPHPVAAIGIALALTACLTFAGNHFFRQPCYPGFAVPNLVDDFYAAGPTDPTDEYTPIGCDPEALQHANPAFWMAANVGDPAPETAAVDYSNDLARRLHFSVSAPVRHPQSSRLSRLEDHRQRRPCPQPSPPRRRTDRPAHRRRHLEDRHRLRPDPGPDRRLDHFSPFGHCAAGRPAQAPAGCMSFGTKPTHAPCEAPACVEWKDGSGVSCVPEGL
jgi:hypothetical protein